MTNEQYQKRIFDLAQKAKANPLLYEKKVQWFARIGFLYFFGFILLIFSLSIFFTTLYVSFHNIGFLIISIAFFIQFTFLLFRSLKKFPQPKSIKIYRDDAPKLFKWLNEIQDNLKLKKVNQVFITADFNASVTQSPTFGLFGRWKNHLYLGLPLMDILTPDMLKSILVHEYAHLAENHGKTNSKMGHLQQLWQILLQNQKDENFIMRFFNSRFLDWYIPRLDSYMHVLMHANEYYCDSVAGEYTGNRNTAKALVTIHVVSSYFDSLFDKRLKEAFATDQDFQPENFKFRLSSIQNAIREGSFFQIDQEKFDRRSSIVDTHPSLKQRLENLGIPIKNVQDLEELIELPPDESFSASKQLFSEQEVNCRILVRDQFEKRFNAEMAMKIKTKQVLSDYYNDIKEIPFTELDSHSINNLFECLRHMFREKEAESVAETAYSMRAEDPIVQAVYGRNLLLNDNVAGLEVIKKLPVTTPVFSLSLSYQIAVSYLRNHDGPESVEHFLKSINSTYEASAFTHNSTLNLKPSTELTAVKLSPWDKKFIKNSLNYLGFIKRAWLIERTDMGVLPRESHILVIEIVNKFFDRENFYTEATQSTSHNLSIFYPCCVIVQKTIAAKVLRKIKKTPDALVFERKK